MHTGRSGLVAAMWWLAACEAVSVPAPRGFAFKVVHILCSHHLFAERTVFIL